jgi:nitronate monooxygenase
MMLSTPWTSAAGLTAPIINAPMGGAAGYALASAVSRAGGLGMIGVGSAGSVEQLNSQLANMSGLDKPFGIGLLGWAVDANPQLLSAALAAKPALLSVSFGDDWRWIDKAHAAGTTAATQVGDVRRALHAVDAGADVIVARGAEAGGHGEPRVGTLPLLCAILERVDVPVVAAGGIGSGRGLAAVLAAGASAAWVGTAFSVCVESMISDGARLALLGADETQTTTTRAFDIALGYPWPSHLPERALRNMFTTRWDGLETELESNTAAKQQLSAAIATDDYQLAPVNAGQGVGEITGVHPAAELIDRMCADAATLLGRWRHVQP